MWKQQQRNLCLECQSTALQSYIVIELTLDVHGGPQTGIADYIFKHPKMSASSAVWLSDEEAFLTGSAEKSLVLWVRSSRMTYDLSLRFMHV